MIFKMQIKQALGWIHKRYLGSLKSEREKAALRHKLLNLPIASDYPFDPEAKLLRHIGIKSPMLDIGANTGLYSAILEDLIGSDKLYIFEPLPHLQRNLKQRFKKAHVYDFALSDKVGKQKIRIPYIDGKRFDTRATFNRHTELNQTDFDEVEVCLFPLDDVVKKLQLESIGFIKIDVEGHELEVLEGGTDTLTRFKPLILIEIESRHHQYSITRIFSKLEDIGYRGYYVNPEVYELWEISKFDTDRDQNQDYLKSRNFIRYLNNFFFVHVESENDFVSNAVAFLNSEKQLVEQGASADARTMRR